MKEAEEDAKASEMQQKEEQPDVTMEDATEGDKTTATSVTASPTSSLSGRRSSTILQRPAFPLKLDLSGASLRLSAEDAANFNAPDGRHSPVTLAPKSARPADFAAPTGEDIMTAIESTANFENAIASQRVDIDLTTASDIDPSLGSADKPIELDLDIDMTDLFGPEEKPAEGPTDATTSVDDLFSPKEIKKELDRSTDFLESLGTASGTQEDFMVSDNPSNNNPSPGALLASFGANSTNTEPNDSQFNLEALDYNFNFGGETTAAEVNLDQYLGVNVDPTQQNPVKTEPDNQ